MGFINNLNKLMKERNINRFELSKESGIPYTTIIGFYERGTDNVRLSTLLRLARYFNITLDELIDDTTRVSTPVDLAKQRLNDNYDLLNQDGKTKLVDYSDDLVQSGKYEEKNEQENAGQDYHLSILIK